MGSIYNFHKVSDLLACAGQPREGQLTAIAEDGYKVVINLGLADGKYALNDEGSLVKKLGMEYHHIPVIFDDPQIKDLSAFIDLMNICADKKTLVHCAANYRASVFTGLYLYSINELVETELTDFIEEIWNPDNIWQLFIENSLNFLATT